MNSKAAFLAFPIFVLFLVALPSQASNASQAGFDLPQPNGCYPVGTKTIVLRDPHRSRDLLVTMWYPAVEGTSAHAPYMDKKTADALAEEWKLQPDFQRLVRTHARTLAALAPQEEPRILAGVNLDGSTFPGMNADVRPVPVRKPLLFLAAEEHASNPAVQIREYVGSESNSYYVIVGGANHGSFTDANLLASRFSRESPPDNSAFERALLTSLLTRSLVEEFFGKYLKATVAPDLDLVVRVDKK